jgi:hypothetical protein
VNVMKVMWLLAERMQMTRSSVLVIQSEFLYDFVQWYHWVFWRIFEILEKKIFLLRNKWATVDMMCYKH